MSDITYIREYVILKIWNSGEGIRNYLAARQELPRQVFMINEIESKDLIDRYMPQLVKVKNELLPEFYELFSMNSKVYAVFYYDPGTNLKSLFDGRKMDFIFRVELLEKIVIKLSEYREMPTLLRSSALIPENICFEDNQLSFNFSLFSDRGALELENYVYKNLGGLVKLFFTDKERKNYVGIRIIEEKCEKGIYKSPGEVLFDINRIYSSLDRTESWKLKMAGIKQKAKKIAGIAVPVVIIAAAGYYFFTYYLSSDVEESMHSDVDRIGTVDVDGVDWENGSYVYIENYDDQSRMPDSLFEESDGESEDREDDNDNAAELFTDVEDEEDLELINERENDLTEDENIYVVKGEDSLSQIVFEEYGTTEYLEEIWELNGIGEDGLIYPGQEIILPDVYDLGEM